MDKKDTVSGLAEQLQEEMAVQPGISEMFQLVLDSIPVRVFWKDRDLVFRGSNALFARDAGVSVPEDLIGLTDYEMGWTKEQAEAFRADDVEVMETNEPKLGIEEPQDHPDGKTHWLETNKIPLRSPDGRVIGVMGTYSDITERKEHEQKVAYMANHDELTDLPNRRHLKSAVRKHELDGKQADWAGLLFIDLDQFKSINDSLGHDVGDRLLRAVARRLTGLLQGQYEVYRLGGDEFAVFMSGMGESEEDARKEASWYAATIIRAFAEPFAIDPHCLYVGASIGISLAPPNAQDLVSRFREADIAMYAAKARAHNSFEVYDATMDAAASRRHFLQNRLRQSDCENGFDLVYQPQYDASGNMSGCEALIRWHDAELGDVSPAEFIPLAEQTGMIHRIGDWVVRRSLNQLAYWCRAGVLPADFRMAVNVSTVQFWDRQFVGRIRDLSSAYGIDPARIEIEITESQPIGQGDMILNVLTELTEAGFRLVIDDFGTGYSSMSYLAKMELTKLKIDRSIVSNICKNPRHRAIAQSIIQLSDNLGVTVVAEGVETAAERNALLDLGCEYFQGYLYGAGCSPGDFHANHITSSSSFLKGSFKNLISASGSA